MATWKQLNLKWTAVCRYRGRMQALGNSRHSSFDSCAWNPCCPTLPAAQFCLITSEGMCFICFSPVFLITCFRELYLLSGGSYYPFPIVYIIILLFPFLFSSDNTMRNSIYQKTEKNSNKCNKILYSSTELVGSHPLFVSIKDSSSNKLLKLLFEREHRLLQTLLHCPTQRASKLYLLWYSCSIIGRTRPFLNNAWVSKLCMDIALRE